jgi:hypothetical protein
MFRVLTFTAVAILSALPLYNSAHAQGRVQVGVLECIVQPSIGAIIGKVREMDCVFKPTTGRDENYSGTQAVLGIDIGVQAKAGLAWAVFAPTVDRRPGELQGTYAGVSADAAVGLGLGANVLLGGSSRTVVLQPLSVEGQIGIGISAGVSSLKLDFLP